MTIKQVYFIGIGGIGMSNLARYYHSRSCRVAGYDRTETELTKQLVKEGMEIHYRDDVEAIPEAFKEVNTTLVVRTPAVSDTHSELQYFRSAGFRIVKRAEVLGEISRELDALCVAGTHGRIPPVRCWPICSDNLRSIAMPFGRNSHQLRYQPFVIRQKPAYGGRSR